MARDFNGTTDRIDYANFFDPSGQAQSISLWVYPDSVAHSQYLLTTHASGDASIRGILLWTDWEGTGGRINFIGYFSSDNVESHTNNGAFSTGSWQHIFINWDGSTTANNIDIYVNNSLQSLLQAKNGSGSALAGDGSWSIGARIYDDNRNFNGRFANFGWWNRELSAGERTALYKGHAPSKFPRLLKWAPDLIRHQRDPISGKAGTLDGTTVIAHPRTIFPMPAMTFYKTPPAVGRTTKNTDSHPLGIHTAMGWRTVGNP